MRLCKMKNMKFCKMSFFLSKRIIKVNNEDEEKKKLYYQL